VSLRIILRALAFFLLWWVLAEGTLRGWPLLVSFVGLATATSFLLLPPAGLRLRPSGLLHFLPYFLLQSFLGGLDVARRALSPKLPLEPGFLDLPLTLKTEAAQVFFTWTVSLLPGTASAELLEGTLKVHVLDEGQDNLAKLKALEARVALLFAER
jgi:multicomponent Na+:H+ antiporter subunit E